MSKRRGYDDSDEHSSSDDDDGNFKRRRRSSDGPEDFVTKSLMSINNPKPLRAVNTISEKHLIEKQKKADEKTAKLTIYDDLFDTLEPTDEVDCGRPVSKAATDSAKEDIEMAPKVIAPKAKPARAELEVDVGADEPKKSEKAISNIDKSLDEVYANLEAKGIRLEETTIDPRMKRLEKFTKFQEHPLISAKPFNPTLPLKERINQSLNNRMPFEAYNMMKREISPLDLPKYRDQILVMAKDFFPSIIDAAFDPRSIYIETPHLIAFQNIIKDVFTFKIKSTEFWESILSSIDKFFRESRILNLPTLAIKLRWIVVQDIRPHIIEQNVRIGTKMAEFILDTRIKLKSDRYSHRRHFEANHNQPKTGRPYGQMLAESEPVEPVAPPPPSPPPVPIIPAIPPAMAARMDQPITEEILPFDDIDLPKPIPMWHTQNPTNRRIKDQIFECLTNDQIIKFIGMLDRHTQNKNYEFLDHFGETLRVYAINNPSKSVFDIYMKIHDYLKLEVTRFYSPEPSKNRLKVIFEKILNQFHETLMNFLYNPKEWLIVRHHSLTEQCRQMPCAVKHFHVENNPFNEPMIPIVHNIIIDCNYSRASSAVQINYRAYEEMIPQSIGNKILKDPRMEFMTDTTTLGQEVLPLNDSVVGCFSPYRQDSDSSPSEPSTSPKYSYSHIVSADNQRSTEDSDIRQMSSPEPITIIDDEPTDVQSVPIEAKFVKSDKPIQKVLPLKSKIPRKQSNGVPLKAKNNSQKSVGNTVIKTKKKALNGPKMPNKTLMAKNNEVINDMNPEKTQTKTQTQTTVPPTRVALASGDNVATNHNTCVAPSAVSDPRVQPKKVISLVPKWKQPEVLKNIKMVAKFSSDESEEEE